MVLTKAVWSILRICWREYSKRILIIWQMAMMADPKATEPRWNLKAHQSPRRTVPCPFVSDETSKYHMQAEAPMMNWAVPMTNALIQKSPKTSYQIAISVVWSHLMIDTKGRLSSSLGSGYPAAKTYTVPQSQKRNHTRV